MKFFYDIIYYLIIGLTLVLFLLYSGCIIIADVVLCNYKRYIKGEYDVTQDK